MWTAVKRKVGLSIGFPALNCCEDEYFGHFLGKYCKKNAKKTVLLDDLFPQHHHASSFKKFIRQRWKYGQSSVLLRGLMKKYALSLSLVLFAISIIFIAFVSLKFALIYVFLSALGFILYRRRLWYWIFRYYGVKVTVACIFLCLVGNVVSILSMYKGMITSKKIKIYCGA